MRFFAPKPNGFILEGQNPLQLGILPKPSEDTKASRKDLLNGVRLWSRCLSQAEVDSSAAIYANTSWIKGIGSRHR
jgi:hypothetical protein